MVNWRGSVQRRSSGVLAVALLCATWIAHAGTLSVADLVVDFRFVGARIDYDPDPARVLETLGGRTDGESHGLADGVRGAGFLDSSGHGDLIRMPFNTFGSLPKAEGVASSDLVQSATSALGGEPLEVIFDSTPLPGALASRLRDARIYATAAGVSLADWLPPYGEPAEARFDFLTAANELAADGMLPAMPAPPTLLLVLVAGLALLVMRRRDWCPAGPSSPGEAPPQTDEARAMSRWRGTPPIDRK
jgi:hypothetical protein